jgi:hypothetical protein
VNKGCRSIFVRFFVAPSTTTSQQQWLQTATTAKQRQQELNATALPATTRLVIQPLPTWPVFAPTTTTNWMPLPLHRKQRHKRMPLPPHQQQQPTTNATATTSNNN